MAKYIDAEELKVELDRQKIGYNIDGKHDAEYDTCVKIVRIIDSLQQKQSEEPIPNDLEEAASGYADKHGFRVPYDGSNNFYDNVDVKASKEGFIAGAKWDREQMMKEAVEGEITKDNRGNNVLRVGSLNNGFEIGDKVKVIIVKEK